MPERSDPPRVKARGAESVLELAAERVSIEKRDVVTGLVRIRLETEHAPECAKADLAGERVEIERVAIGRDVDAAPQVRVECDVTVVPVVEEVLVVEKRLRLVEEIRIRRVPTIEHVETPVTLRRQHAVVEREALGADAPGQEDDRPTERTKT